MFPLGRREAVLLLVLVILLAAGITLKATVFAPEPIVIESAAPPEQAEVEGSGEITQKEDIFVHMAGDVVNPGVYVLPQGSRVFQALDAAGGPLPDADVAAVNLAAVLSDGQKIYIPAAGEEEIINASGDSADSSSLVNINSASRDELMKLPGIGEVKAGKIIEYRQQHGSFTSADDLLNVSGIGEATLDGIRELIYIY